MPGGGPGGRNAAGLDRCSVPTQDVTSQGRSPQLTFRRLRQFHRAAPSFSGQRSLQSLQQGEASQRPGPGCRSAGGLWQTRPGARCHLKTDTGGHSPQEGEATCWVAQQLRLDLGQRLAGNQHPSEDLRAAGRAWDAPGAGRSGPRSPYAHLGGDVSTAVVAPVTHRTWTGLKGAIQGPVWGTVSAGYGQSRADSSLWRGCSGLSWKPSVSGVP